MSNTVETTTKPKRAYKPRTKAAVAAANKDAIPEMPTFDSKALLEEIMKEEKEIASHQTEADETVLGHLGKDADGLFSIIESYFKGRYSSMLVRHQLESYNDCVNRQLHQTIDMFNPVMIRSDKDFIAELNQYLL